jgi:hypothetical protein
MSISWRSDWPIQRATGWRSLRVSAILLSPWDPVLTRGQNFRISTTTLVVVVYESPLETSHFLWRLEKKPVTKRSSSTNISSRFLKRDAQARTDWEKGIKWMVTEMERFWSQARITMKTTVLSKRSITRSRAQWTRRISIGYSKRLVKRILNQGRHRGRDLVPSRAPEPRSWAVPTRTNEVRSLSIWSRASPRSHWHSTRTWDSQGIHWARRGIKHWHWMMTIIKIACKRTLMKSRFPDINSWCKLIVILASIMTPR